MRYEVCVCIATGWIVSILGPFPCGHWPDITIFRNFTKNRATAEEFILADSGYAGEDMVVTIEDTDDPVVINVISVSRARHEAINGLFKKFAVLDNTFHHDVLRHSVCFNAVAVLVQLHLMQGKGTFSVADLLEEFENNSIYEDIPDEYETNENQPPTEHHVRHSGTESFINESGINYGAYDGTMYTIFGSDLPDMNTGTGMNDGNTDNR